LGKLIDLRKLYPDVIHEVRGKGLMIGIELTKEGIGGLILSEMIDKGVLIAYTLNNPKVIRIEPPLIIEKRQIDYVIESMSNALAKAQDMLEDL